MTILLIICTFLLLCAGFGLPKLAADKDDPLKRPLKIAGFSMLVISGLWASYYSVPAGYRGVLLQFGAVHGVLDEGPHFVTPFVQDVQLIEVRTQKDITDAAASSHDLQTVQAKITTNFHLEPRSVGDLYRRVGPDYDGRIIDPAVQETVKAVCASYTAEELIRDRFKVKAEIDEALVARLEAYDIKLEAGGVSITNFDFSADFNKAIEAKQVAQQSAEQQKYVLQKAELEAQTAITAAKGTAESSRITAQALNASGGSKVLAQAWIQKWDGHLPQVASNSSFMLTLSDLMKEGGK